jgi:hypothetical protein
VWREGKNMIRELKIVAIGIITSSAAYACCFHEEKTDTESPVQEYTVGCSEAIIRFFKTFDRYTMIRINKASNKAAGKAAQDFLNEALYFFDKQTHNLGKNQHSAVVFLNEYIKAHNVPSRMYKIMRFYLFALDFIATNNRMTDQDSIQAIACSFFKLGGNLDQIVFCWDKENMPIMKKKPEGQCPKDVYDLNDIRSLQRAKPYHLKSTVDTLPSTQP